MSPQQFNCDDGLCLAKRWSAAGAPLERRGEEYCRIRKSRSRRTKLCGRRELRNKERRMDYAVRKLPMQDADQALISIGTAATRLFRRNTLLPGNIDSSDRLESVENTSMAVNRPDSRRVNDADEQDAGVHTRQLRADAASCLLTACSHLINGE